MTDTDLLQPKDLADVHWPDNAIFIIDSALPEELVAPVPEPRIFVDAGESLKTLSSVGTLAERVLSLRSSRPLTLVAVGGGSLGDAAGFLASILWRGVDLWHVPTTLVAMVDSAHGGKTAVNLEGHKNQLGTFHVAKKVVACQSFLKTLPLDQREEGLVELLKGLWLEMPQTLDIFDDPRRYDVLLAGDIASHRPLWTEIIDAAVRAKWRVVEKDPRETSGHRRILNLGHTAGHGLEVLYGLSHGRAVAWGLAACAQLSTERAGLSDDDAQRLWNHLDPLLIALPDLDCPPDRDAFCRHLRRDKKRRGDRLISILLDGPGQPVQTDQVCEKDWWNALRRAHHKWRKRSVVVSAPHKFRSTTIELPPDKSRHNRAAIIAHLRPGPVELSRPMSRPAADAIHLQRALKQLESVSPDEAVEVHAGEGGTTGRFLMALCANRSGTTALHFAPGLRRRPHAPLVEALRDAGATIDKTDTGFSITGWPAPPTAMRVDASTSSQFASALALLSACGHRFELQLQGPLASKPYFEITLEMLRDVGVEVEVSGNTLFFSPTDDLGRRTRLFVPGDTSSAVVWRAIAVLRDHFPAPEFPEVDHPDQKFDAIARRLSTPGACVSADLSDAPDLACVLAALASLMPASLTVTNASHLRHKESNRIDDLADALSEVGISIEPRPDGFYVDSPVQTPTPHATFDPRGDHRLAMAALVLATSCDDLGIDDAECVAKSYPELWRQARRLGYTIAPTPHI